MEILDICDELGNPTGKTVEREIAHQQGILHRTAHVWILRKKENKIQILLQKRSEQKDSFPGCYDISSAGHIPAGDNYGQSAVRELKEELGIVVRESELIDCGNRRFHFEEIFHGRLFKDNQVSKIFVLWKDLEEKDFVFVSSKSSLIFKTQGLKALCFIRKSHLDNDFKVFKQLYDEECKNEMKLIFELNKGMNKNQMAYITLMSDDIIYAECYAHELIIHTYEHEYAVKMTLKKFMEQVKQAHCFIQIHRSYAINMKYIYRIDKNYINMVNEESKNELEIGRKYKKEVNEAFRNYLMDKF